VAKKNCLQLLYSRQINQSKKVLYINHNRKFNLSDGTLFSLLTTMIKSNTYIMSPYSTDENIKDGNLMFDSFTFSNRKRVIKSSIKILCRIWKLMRYHACSCRKSLSILLFVHLKANQREKSHKIPKGGSTRRKVL